MAAFNNNEIPTAGEASFPQAGAQASINPALYESAYPGAPGTSAGTNNSALESGAPMTVGNANLGYSSGGMGNTANASEALYTSTIGNGAVGNSAVGNSALTSSGSPTDYASQGLSQIQSGDQYDGIMSLLMAAEQNPQSINNQTFLQNLQLVEPTTGAAAASSSLDSTAGNSAIATALPGATGTGSDATAATSAIAGATPGASSTDASTVAMQGLQDSQSPTTAVQGMLELMQASTLNPNLGTDQNFLAAMSQVLPGAQQGAVDTIQGPVTDANGGAMTPISLDANNNIIAATDNGAPLSATASAAQPSDAGAGTPSAATAAQPSDTGAGTTAAQPQLDANGNPIQPTAASNPAAGTTQLTDTTNNPASGSPQLQTAIQQALTYIAQGDQYDGAALLMQIAKYDPGILTDQIFMQNLTAAEQAATQAGQSQSAATAGTSGDATPQVAAATDGTGTATGTSDASQLTASPTASALTASPAASALATAQPAAAGAALPAT